jgi:tubulin monoglycylase TTLL15
VCSKLWDVGVYVAITSINPLRVYIYDNLLLRHCTANYTWDLRTAAPESYVVAEEYAPPWTIEPLRGYYVRGFSTANVLRAYLQDHGATFSLPNGCWSMFMQW